MSTGPAPPAGRPHKKPLLGRTLGSPALFAVTYTTLAGGVYLLLGPIAGNALGATPIVMIAAAVLFGLALMTYVEGSSSHPERGGAATFARHAFDETWSFVAAWVLLLDAVLLTAAATLSATNYLGALWGRLDHGLPEMGAAALILGAVTVGAVRGRPPRRASRLIALVSLDLALHVLVIVVGVALLANPGSLTDGLDIGTTPSWDGIVFALGVAMVVVFALESAATFSGELRMTRSDLRRLTGALPLTMLVLYPGIAIAGLRALPVVDGSTALSDRWVDAPVLGIVSQVSAGDGRDVLRVVIGLAGALTLVAMAAAAMGATTRIVAGMSRHRQIPARIGRLHPAYGTPWLVSILTGLVALGLVALGDIDALIGTMAFGAMLALTIAHLSVARLRMTEPDLHRPYRVPIGVPFRGAVLPLPTLVGALLSFLVFLAVVASHPTARWVGLGWLLLGVVGYVAYRRSRGLSIRERVAVPEAALRGEESRSEYGSILVPILGTDLDDDLVQTAGRLAGGDDDTDPDEAQAVIEAVWIHVLPMSLPLDGPLPEARIDQARAGLGRAKAVGEEYEGVRVATSVVRARAVGRAIVEEATRRGCQAIVMAAPPRTDSGRGPGPGSRVGARGGRGEVLGEVARHVIDKAPCQVLLTAPALAESDPADRTRRKQERAAQVADERRIDDDDERWLEQL